MSNSVLVEVDRPRGREVGVPEDPAASNRKFREEVDIINKAWSGRPFSHSGEFYSLPPNLATLPHPVQAKAPLWVGSASDESAEWATQQGLPYATIAWPLTIMEGYDKRYIHFAAAEKANVDVSANENVLSAVLLLRRERPRGC